MGRLLDPKDIVSVKRVSGVTKVYDLMVEDNSNFMLAIGCGIVVHNSTKSSFTSIEIILGIMRDAEANAVCFRRFENEIRDSVFSQLEWAINKLGVNHLFTFRTSPFKIIYNPTGQVILFKGADNPKKLKSIKLAKGYIRYVWLEEVDQFGGMAEIRNILQSVLRGTTEHQTTFYTYNPPKSARSWANAESKVAKPGRVVHYSDYRDVPEDWLGPTFLANAKHLKETNEDAYNHEYLGMETGTGLEVFNNVTLRKITAKEISYFDSRNQGLDFGYAADPLCFLEGHFDAKKKILYLFYELSGVGITNAKFASKLSEDRRHEVTMSDSSEPKSIEELRTDYKVNIVGAEKPPGSVDHGIKYLQDLEEIVIDPARCPLAATEFVNYALKTDRMGEVISKYPDKENHCFAPWTKVSTTEGAKRIDKIKVGDMVLTRKGPRRVNKVFCNGEQEVVTTKLFNGKSLTLTDTHNIITGRGHVKFKDLTVFDTVYYEGKGCKYIETENRKSVYLRARNIAGIQRAKDDRTRCISDGRCRREKTKPSMWQFMKRRMALYLKAVMYTIRMATLSTMNLIIWPVSMVEDIYLGTQWSTTRAMLKRSERIWRLFGPSLKHGIEVPKVENGILNTVSGYMRIESSEQEPVRGVMWSTGQSTQEYLDFVLPRVKQNGDENQGSMTWSENVRGAVRRFLLTSTPFASTAEIVYDIEVDEVHEYFAEGLLVSNSIDATRYMMNLHIMDARKASRKKFKTLRIPVASRW